MRSRITITILLLGLALGSVLAACGGGYTSNTVTKAQFITRADAICEKADEDQLKIMGSLPKETPERQAVDAALAVTQRQAEELEALNSPVGEKREVAEIVRAIEAAVTQAEDAPLSEISRAFQKPDRLAAAYGLKACNEAL